MGTANEPVCVYLEDTKDIKESIREVVIQMGKAILEIVETNFQKHRQKFLNEEGYRLRDVEHFNLSILIREHIAVNKKHCFD